MNKRTFVLKAFAFMKQTWGILLQISVWILSMIGAFLLPPPLYDIKADNDNLMWFQFSKFFIAGIIGLMLIPIQKWKGTKFLWYWWLFSIAIFILCVGAYFLYNNHIDEWTLPYGGSRIVIGNTMLPDAIKLKDSLSQSIHSKISDKELIMYQTGENESIWQIDEIISHRHYLEYLYIFSVAMFSIFSISLIQAIYCNQKTL